MPDLPSTIKYPNAFNKSKPPGFDGICDFSQTSQVINRRNISPMDFDKVVEINYHYLVEETKDPGVPIKKGQKQCLERLRKAKSFTVMFTEGKGKDPIKTIILHPNGDIEEMDGDQRDAFQKSWADRAEEDSIDRGNK